MSYYDAYSPGGEDDPWASAPEPMVRMKPTVIMGMICQVRVCIGCGRGPIEPGSNGCGECEWTMAEDPREIEGHPARELWWNVTEEIYEQVYGADEDWLYENIEQPVVKLQCDIYGHGPDDGYGSCVWCREAL